MELDQGYWQDRYLSKNTPWDIGHVPPPLKELMDALSDKNMRILIPGAGSSHEAVYLHRIGFQQVFVCDWVESAFDLLKAELPDFPKNRMLCCDFFALESEFDLILEQTFFCALSPSLRKAYVSKVASMLSEGGILAGLLFASPFEKEGPPFGGTETEYKELFSGKFEVKQMEMAKNSILPRANNELFFNLKKK